MSRVITERISVAPCFSRSGLSHSVEQTAPNGDFSPRRTVAIIHENDTVTRENDTDIGRQYLQEDALFWRIKWIFAYEQPCVAPNGKHR